MALVVNIVGKYIIYVVRVLEIMGHKILQKTNKKVEDTRGVIRSHKSVTDRHCNGQQKRNKSTNNGSRNTTQKTKD